MTPGRALVLPDSFWEIPYKAEHFPGAVPPSLIGTGANCQFFAYQVLALFGRHVPDLWSSDLWEDDLFTERVPDPEPLDLVLYSGDGESSGAHVGVVWGDDEVLHLCAEVGVPVVWPASEFASRERYAQVIGYKRVRATAHPRPT